MKKFKFKVKLDGMEGSSVAALSAPFDVQKIFGTKARVPVRGAINGFPFRSSLMPMGGCHRIVVNKTLRDGAGVKAGDTVIVEIERDEAPRVVEPPTLLKKHLAKASPQTKTGRSSAIHTKKKWLGAIAEAKQEETRMRRLQKIMDALESGKKWTG